MKRALIRTSFSPVIYEVLDFAAALYDRDVSHARPGAVAAHVHGHDELLRDRRRGGGGRRGGARAGRHHPLQRPLRHRLAPAGRGRGHAGLPARRRARRLRGDQGPLAGHRRQGPVLDRHGRRLPGGHDLPGRQAVLARAAGQRHLPDGRGQQPRAEDGGGRHQRARGRRARRGGGAGPRRRAPRRGRRSASASSACTPPARRSCARGSRSSPTAATSATARWTPTASPRSACRSRWRSRSPARTCASTTRTRRPSAPARSTARCRPPCPPPGSPSRCWPGGGEAPNEGHFRAIDVVTKPGTLFHPEPPAPCFLYGWASDQAMEVIYQALYSAMPEAVPASSGGDICALVFWGNRERTREPWTDGGPHGVGQGAQRARRRPERADAHLRGGHARDLRRGGRGQEPVADGPGRAGAGLGGRRAPPRRAGRRPLLPLPGGLLHDLDGRADQERAVGAGRRHVRRARTRSSSSCPTARACPTRRPPGWRSPRAPSCTCARAAAGATARRPSATPPPSTRTSAPATSATAQARELYPHAFSEEASEARADHAGRHRGPGRGLRHPRHRRRRAHVRRHADGAPGAGGVRPGPAWSTSTTSRPRA